MTKDTGKMSAQELLHFNQTQALSHLLSVEEHLQLLPADVAPSESWCRSKHSLLAVNHHLAEAVNHASRLDPALADDYREFRERAEKVLHTNEPLDRPPSEEIRLEEVATLRNEFRQLVNEHTAKAGGSCPVCSADSAAAARADLAPIMAKIEKATQKSEKADRGRVKARSTEAGIFPELRRRRILPKILDD